jgi:hypothetical protein
MVVLKLFIAGAIMAFFVGAGSLAVLGVEDIGDDIWGGRGHGGGCRGQGEYYDDGGIRSGEEDEPPCHRFDDDRSEDDYCEYHDEYFSEEEWEEHGDGCPYYDEEI